jgi:hypothetical protein
LCRNEEVNAIKKKKRVFNLLAFSALSAIWQSYFSLVHYTIQPKILCNKVIESHPRYLIEMVTFLMGYGIDEKITPDSLGSGARIFALGVLYPRNLLNRVLSDQFYQEIARKYQIEVFGGKFPDINTEALVSKYVPKARNEIQELKDEAYKKIEEEWFDREARGFLIRPRRF